jgi:hypothetical protein
MLGLYFLELDMQMGFECLNLKCMAGVALTAEVAISTSVAPETEAVTAPSSESDPIGDALRISTLSPKDLPAHLPSFIF